VDDYARPLTKEIYQEQLRLADRSADLVKRDCGFEQQFDKDRLLAKDQALVFDDPKRSSEKPCRCAWNFDRPTVWCACGFLPTVCLSDSLALL
tara:strand:+ start:51 stop:329 length:279 start_codon:yes stop_codon:yes gene_type:complete